MKKARKLLLELERHSLWVRRCPLRNWTCYRGPLEPGRLKTLDMESLSRITLPHGGAPGNSTVWYFHQVHIEKRWSTQRHLLYLDVSESLLYLNNRPYQGIDAHHDICALPGGSRSVQLALEVRGGGVFRTAELGVINEPVRALISLLRNTLELMAQLDGRMPCAELEKVLTETAARFGGIQAGEEGFTQAAETGLRDLQTGLERLRAGARGELLLLGHSHIDIAWLWTMDETKRKGARTFSTVLRLLEEYGEFRFIASQPQLYHMIKTSYPSIYRQIVRQVAAGRWEPVGGMWVEADCNLPGGESLVRQILYGVRFFEREFGIRINTLWAPDTFGFTAALPKILKKSGIEFFFTHKLAWNDTASFPYDRFTWEGMDGSQVWALSSSFSKSCNAQVEIEQIFEAQSRTLPFLSVGWGDGGGGPGIRDLENSRDFNLLPALPSIRFVPLKEVCTRLRGDPDALPLWRGELYFEHHRGTFTTRARMKWLNRRCESVLRDAELLAVLTGLNSGRLRSLLNTCWRDLLTTQFHDILPGSAIAEVYEEAEAACSRVLQSALRVKQRALDRLLPRGRRRKPLHLAVFNTLSWCRNDVVRLKLPPGLDDFVLCDSRGRAVPAQRLDRSELLFVAENVPAFGYARYHLTTEDEDAGRATGRSTKGTSPWEIDTPLYSARFNQAGELLQLFDRLQKRPVFPEGRAGNVIQTFRDNPAVWEAWNIDPDYNSAPLSLFEEGSAERIASGPVCSVLRVRRASARSTLEQDILFYHGLRRIDFVTRVDWHERRVLMKVAFPAPEGRLRHFYEIQFGAIERAPSPARFEVPAQRWADVSSGTCGLSLMNSARYGYDFYQDQLRLTLLRSAFSPDPQDPELGVDLDAPADDGVFEFTYSILPHRRCWRQANTVRRAHELNSPLLVHLTSEAPAPCKPWLEIVEGSSIVLETLKWSEEGSGVVLRLYESSGESGQCRIRFRPPERSVLECDLMERNARSAEYRNGELRFDYNPFEIKTFLLRRDCT